MFLKFSRRILAGASVVCMLAANASAENVKPIFEHALPNVEGKVLTTVEVNFAPGARADPHRHGQAFVYAYVLEGSVRSQLGGEAARIYHVGESWFEPPGAAHVLTQNMSAKKPARLLVVFVSDAGEPLRTAEPSSKDIKTM